MKLKYQFVITSVADEVFAVPIESNGEFNGVIAINETMKDIIELLAVDRTEENLAIAMLEKYKNVTEKEMKTSIHETCVRLKNDNLLA